MAKDWNKEIEKYKKEPKKAPYSGTKVQDPQTKAQGLGKKLTQATRLQKDFNNKTN